MAMTTCRECGGQVSQEARSCPACGVPTPSARRRRSRDNVKALVVFGLFVAVLFLLYALGD